jgi:NADH dehydrogenase FAD-containing subunit
MSHSSLTDDQRRKLLSFIIVGGGPTGSELAAELHDMVTKDLKRLFPDIAHLSKVRIIDASGGILNNFDDSLAKYAREKFARDGIEVLLNRSVKEVQPGILKVEPDGEFPFGLLVWSTGNTASPFVEHTSCFAKDDRNSFFLTDDRLRVLLPSAEHASGGEKGKQPEVFPNIFAIGDAAQIKDGLLPATAQVASQKATHLATMLNGQKGDAGAFEYVNRGAMASIGSGSAIIDGPKGKAHGRVSEGLKHPICKESAYIHPLSCLRPPLCTDSSLGSFGDQHIHGCLCRGEIDYCVSDCKGKSTSEKACAKLPPIYFRQYPSIGPLLQFSAGI